jgi:DNA-binding transcriptional MerR regulator
MALTIGELGKATATKVETIRYYERIGLLSVPERTGSNYRTYGTAALGRLSFIRRARDLGFSLGQVRELLEIAGDHRGDCAIVDEIARDHLAQVERKMTDLQALHRELTALIGSCHGGTVAQCRIIDALAPTSTFPTLS